MSNATTTVLPWHRREDTWAIIIALGLVLGVTLAFFLGAAHAISTTALSFPTWSESGKLLGALGANPVGPLALFAVFLAAFSVASLVIGWDVAKYAAGFALLFAFSIVVTALGSNALLKQWQLETPLLALAVGMVLGNLVTLPGWFQSALRTEFYVKVGIVLMGATLPFTIIVQAGPLAIVQATIVAVTTFVAIYLAATRLFGLDPRFGATLGAGGSICGVSAAIAIGGACRAEKSHVSVAISMVILWAVAMIFALPFACRALGLAPGVAGAWVGTSEFADAAGYAAAATIGDERAVKTFTLMKVVGRDMFVGIWAIVVAFLAVTRWDRKSAGEAEKVGLGEIWRRFPKFILGFLVASLVVTVILASFDSNVGTRFSKDAIGPLKNLRGWAFTWTFLSIGFTTRFRELTRFGWRPFAAFALGVLVNVPLGYWLSTHVFDAYWLAVK
ncbi:YeiH family protein [Anaeromyxobacter oryzae]|uniref:Membrane protein n=1 Tax=Anaeromyxobacter oryzae TaxID=2918170 RepID=A0ABN6MN54_9BACT|nr:putative sulfate exporter family transporter [Anaeromyxobacter oryzae]BDG02396.1 membrane protein [Anaeromyxobacter oryzae]